MIRIQLSQLENHISTSLDKANNKLSKFGLNVDNIWLDTYSYINNILSTLTDNKGTITLIDYFFFTVRYKKYKNIKEEVKTLMKSNKLEILDIYKLAKNINIAIIKTFSFVPQDKNEEVSTTYNFINFNYLLNDSIDNEIIDKETDAKAIQYIMETYTIHVLSLIYEFITYLMGVLKPYRFNLSIMRDTNIYNKKYLSELHDCLVKQAVELLVVSNSDFTLASYIEENKDKVSIDELAQNALNITTSIRSKISKNLALETDNLRNLEIETVLCVDLIRKLLPDKADIYLDNINPYNDIAECHLRYLVDKESICEIHPSVIEALKYRNFLVPTQGISLHNDKLNKDGVLTPMNYVRAINLDIFERQYDGDNYIIIIDTTTTSAFTIINLNKGIGYSNSLALYDTLLTILYFYKVMDKTEKFRATDETLLYHSYKMSNLIQTGIILLKGKSEIYNNLDVTVPYYWKQHNKDNVNMKKDYCTHSKLPNLGTYQDIIKISPFKRKLQQGAKASEDAKKLAKLYCVALTEDETFVKPFNRKQRKLIK